MSLPDIVLLDLNMPILDGFGFLEEFKRLDLANHDQVQIIVVSSSENPEDIKRAKNLGASRYIAKPLLEETLRKALENS
jgi:CheY-like chemotaxis protein